MFPIRKEAKEVIKRTLCRICDTRPALVDKRGRTCATCDDNQCKIAAYSTRLTKGEDWPPRTDPWEDLNVSFGQLALKPSPAVRLDKPEARSITGCATAQCSQTGG